MLKCLQTLTPWEECFFELFNRHVASIVLGAEPGLNAMAEMTRKRPWA
ncbi:MAG: hypothetical protein P4L64_06025 [Caulobacteraceae bacterium]|nr:hypothetical protein [Caulobacteraceae bacterium]